MNPNSAIIFRHLSQPFPPPDSQAQTASDFLRTTFRIRSKVRAWKPTGSSFREAPHTGTHKHFLTRVKFNNTMPKKAAGTFRSNFLNQTPRDSKVSCSPTEDQTWDSTQSKNPETPGTLRNRPVPWHLLNLPPLEPLGPGSARALQPSKGDPKIGGPGAGEALTAPLTQHPADLLFEVAASLQWGKRGSEGGRRAAAAVGIGFHEEDVPAVLLEPPAGREGWVPPGVQAHGEQGVLLQAPSFYRPHLVHLHQIGRRVPELVGAGRRGPGGQGPVGSGRRVLGGRWVLGVLSPCPCPCPCLARCLPVECPLLPPRRVHLSLDHHRGAPGQLLHRAHAGRRRVAHRGPHGSRPLGRRPRRQGRGPQQQQQRQQQRQQRRRAAGGPGMRGAGAGTQRAARGASPSHGVRCVRAPVGADSAWLAPAASPCLPPLLP